MNASTPPGAGPDMHLATLAHDGAIWDAYLEFESDPRRPGSHRARIRFDPPTDGRGRGSTSTTVILIEESYEAVVAKARRFDDRQLQDLLRSTLPDTEADEDAEAP